MYWQNATTYSSSTTPCSAYHSLLDISPIPISAQHSRYALAPKRLVSSSDAPLAPTVMLNANPEEPVVLTIHRAELLSHPHAVLAPAQTDSPQG